MSGLLMNEIILSIYLLKTSYSCDPLLRIDCGGSIAKTGLLCSEVGDSSGLNSSCCGAR